MAADTNVSQLNGLFKEVYAEKVMHLMPDVAILSKRIPFNENTKIGNKYNQPVKLTRSQGVTYAGPDAGAYVLNSSIASTTKNAEVQGSQLTIRDRLPYDAANKASHGDKKSFVNATRYLVDSMLESMSHRLEVAMLYGGSGIAKIASRTNTDATHTVLTVKTSDWAVGIWSGMEGGQLQFYNATTLVSSGANSIYTVDSMDVDARTLTLSGTATGITDLDTAVNSNPNVITAYFNGAYGNEMAGFNKIITNTGTLFNISAASYNMWKGITHTVTGTLTFAKVLGGVNKAIGRGLNEMTTLLVGPNTWKDLASDLSALRSLDQSYGGKKVENGMEVLEYYSSNGKIEVISHPCVKEGDAFVVPLKKVKRIGEADVKFQQEAGSGINGDIFFHTVADMNAFELRAWTDQAVFIECPARSVKITGFTNA